MIYVFFAGECALALSLFFAEAPKFHGDFLLLLGLIGINIVAGLAPVRIYGETSISIGFVFTMTVMILFGVPGAVILAPLAALGNGLGRRSIDRKVITNAALFTIVYAASAAVYDLVAEVDPTDASLSMAFGAVLASVVSYAVNAALLATSRRLADGLSYRDFWDRHSWVLPHFLAMGLVGVALAAAHAALGPAGIVAFITPALMMRLAMKQYVDKTTENVEKLQEQNVALHSANIEVRRMSDELKVSYDSTLEALVSALDARDQETKGHSIRVSHYMMDIAREMGVREGTQQWVDMQRGSLLHDVGKIGVSDNILLKPGKLTPEEWDSMRKHPEIGFNMLRQVKFLEGAAELVLAHHERWDGKGYPKGLGGTDIPMGARIFNVVDTFDSMTSDRPYRKALTTLDALNEILRNRGTQFDPQVVEAFLDIYDTWVKEREELHSLTELEVRAA